MTYFERRCIKQNLFSIFFFYKAILGRKGINKFKKKKKKKEKEKKGRREKENVNIFKYIINKMLYHCHSLSLQKASTYYLIFFNLK